MVLPEGGEEWQKGGRVGEEGRGEERRVLLLLVAMELTLLAEIPLLLAKLFKADSSCHF